MLRDGIAVEMLWGGKAVEILWECCGTAMGILSEYNADAVEMLRECYGDARAICFSSGETIKKIIFFKIISISL